MSMTENLYCVVSDEATPHVGGGGGVHIEGKRLQDAASSVYMSKRSRRVTNGCDSR